MRYVYIALQNATVRLRVTVIRDQTGKSATTLTSRTKSVLTMNF